MKIVYYDLETTGLNWNRDAKLHHVGVQIVSIGAYFKRDEKKFESYLIPTKPIDPDATKVNGMSLNSDGDLVRNGSVVKDALELKSGLQYFISFLKDEVIRKQDEQVILVAHCNRRFDSVVLKRNLILNRMRLPKGVAFYDPMDIMLAAKEMTPAFQADHRNSLNNFLWYFFEEKQSDPHDVMEDTLSIAKLTEKLVRKVHNMSLEKYLEQNRGEIYQPKLR